MTTANCSGNEELDFRLIFGEDGQQQSLGPADLEQDDNPAFYILNVGQPQSVVNQPIGIPRHGLQTHSPVISAPPRLQPHKAYDSLYEAPGPRYSPAGGHKAFECPSIQITSISPNCQQDMEAGEDDLRGPGPEGDFQERPLSRDHLYLPLDYSYRDASLSPSPCSSLSSRSWFSDASSCESFSHVYDDVDSELNEAAARFTLGEEAWQHPHPAFGPSLSPRQSPCQSPRTSVTDENWLSPRPQSRPSSRPASPCGKRRHSSADICYPGSASPHHSPAPTPGHSPRGSVTEDSWIGSPSGGVSPFQCCPSEADIPSKTRRTSQDRSAPLGGKVDMVLEDPGCVSPSLESPVEDAAHALKKDAPAEHFLSVPSHFTWSKPKPGHSPIFRTSSLPPLDWPLPSQFGQCELKIEVQPKAHHRAHYETEGSRGAVKAASGGHPVVKLIGYNEKPINLQMFIGTADDRYLRPHAFYQVHRITGKTVATASQEIIIASTKVLEIPLLPENNMSASIDCAGILKLRNSDIELRKGETDIGRKNTRVRVVFRVHIPQPGGKVLSLQASSIPVECSQRSAQELPQVEKYSLNSCSVSGGEEMVITGSNFFPETKVIFLEKGPDGRPQWEVDAKILREKSQGSTIVVEVPPYHSKALTSAVQVQFYVCNGKRKRSQSQRFTYLSVMVKQEHRDELDPPMPLPLPLTHPARTQLPSPDGSPRGLVPGMAPPPPLYPPMAAPFQQLPHLQSCQLIGSPLAFHSAPPMAPPPPSRPSYPPLQHSLPYNGQPGLPMSAGSPQAYERMPFQPDPLGLGVAYHSGSTPPSAGSQPLSHLHSLGYPCPNPVQVTSPSHPRGQLQHGLPYHPMGQRSASCPSPTHTPLPHSGPSSPQLHSLPYQSPPGGPASSPSPTSSSPLVHLPSPQAGSPGVGSLPSVGPLVPPLGPQPPFSPEEERLSIKQEPEDKELGFHSIGLQDITLDDVNEIIGRDMSQSPASHGPTATHSQT
ncbi:nuclear factor of activated T-cells, cytoplasmic 3-like isoform X1 [Anguilla rostrata]|uniref:nuclear factor of activated T-cells, cytoplasmic 3-like isoform X1 n=1 Tax=Anguilla rostrata TaxID=7938 RepID=UPI0030D3D037